MVEASKLRAKLQAWYAHRQGLDGSLEGKPPAEVLQRAGWARSVGGVSPYFTLFSRAGIAREQADAAAKKLEIYELPSARGCTYVLPASDFALGLAAGRGFDGEMKTAAKLGVTEKEIAKLCEAVVAALEEGPLDPEALREAAGKAARNLGAEGKKKGLTTTLPLALGELQSTGDIRRVPVNGRFDQQRYQYALWRPSPLRGFKLSPEEVHTELARKYFGWFGPASAAGFQRFSGLGVKAAKAALEPLKLEPIEIAPGEELFLLPGDRSRLDSFKPPKEAHYALLGSIDSLFEHRGQFQDFEGHAIVDRGRLVGLWEYDQPTESIAWVSFVKKDKALQQAVTRTENFVRDQLGDARSFSLDSPKSRAPRIAALRKAAASA
jgi:hypothetical protein